MNKKIEHINSKHHQIFVYFNSIQLTLSKRVFKAEVSE